MSYIVDNIANNLTLYIFINVSLPACKPPFLLSPFIQTYTGPELWLVP